MSINKEKKVISSKGKISFTSSDDSNLTLEFVMPYELAHYISCFIIDWKNRVSMTPNEYEDYKEVEEKFIENCQPQTTNKNKKHDG